MRSSWLVVVVVLISGCGKIGLLGGGSASWPATITSYQGFSDTQKAELATFVSNFNQREGVQIISTDPNSGGYPVTLTLQDPPANSPDRAGYTTRSDSSAAIQLSTILYTSQYESYRETVFDHEFGHAAGLMHNPEVGTIMYAMSESFSSYSAIAMQGFLTDVSNAVGFNPPSLSTASWDLPSQTTSGGTALFALPNVQLPSASPN
jgi:Dual-action HEIGH metallo-peptidase